MSTQSLVKDLSLAADHQFGYVMAEPKTLKEWKEVVEGDYKEMVDFVHINGKMLNPVYQLWCFREAKMMAEVCHVVFTDVKDSTTWRDLVDCYGGVRFGTLFLMVYRKSTRVGVYPSQLGMYMK